MKVTFRKVNESKIPKEPKPNEKDLNKKTTKGEFTKDSLKVTDKKIANTAKDLIPKKLRTQKSAKQVVESNDFIPEGPDGLNDDLSDKDRQIQLAATHNTENPVAENHVHILSFEQFINEAEDFQAQFAPGDAEAQAQAEADDDSDISTAESPEEDDDADGTELENDDSWYMDGNDEGDEDGEAGIGEPEEDGDDMYAIQAKLSSINGQITDMLKQFQDGQLNVQQYKEKASPLLAQRKDLQAKLDQTFNMSLGGEEGVGEEGVPDGEMRY